MQPDSFTWLGHKGKICAKNARKNSRIRNLKSQIRIHNAASFIPLVNLLRSILWNKILCLFVWSVCCEKWGGIIHILSSLCTGFWTLSPSLPARAANTRLHIETKHMANSPVACSICQKVSPNIHAFNKHRLRFHRPAAPQSIPLADNPYWMFEILAESLLRIKYVAFCPQSLNNRGTWLNPWINLC